MEAQLSQQIKTYVNNCTRYYYEKYPDEVEKAVTTNLTSLAQSIISAIKNNPQKNSLSIHGYQLMIDCEGYKVVHLAMRQMYKITLDSPDDVTSCSDSYPQTQHELLKTISVQLRKCYKFSTQIEFKADNPFIFPTQPLAPVIAPLYDPQVHLQAEWEMAKNGLRTDIEFSVEGQRFKAHRMKLAMHAEYEKFFEFGNAQPQDAVVEVRNISAPNFAILLEFVYTGFLKELATLEQMLQFLYIADNYRVKAIDKICANRIYDFLQKNSMDPNGLGALFTVANQIEDSFILPVCLVFVETHQNLKACLTRALAMDNVSRYEAQAKTLNLPFVLDHIKQCKEFNPTLTKGGQ